MTYRNDDVRINKIEELLPPVALLERFPASDIAADTVSKARSAIHKILHGKDDRLLVVIGPCSIHDPKAALEYAEKLREMRANPKIKQNLEVVMRVYFEKPRTTVGWKGLINDPYLNETFALNDGLRIARKVLSDINDLTVPAAGEFLDMITPQYVADFMSWGAIGARTTESQVHRELASGLSCAVGFKNGTNGSVKIALDAIGAAESPHHFLSVTKFGHSAIVSTQGNPDCHIILRGGDNGTNYDEESVTKVCADIEKSGRRPHVMIDFSHANSQKQFKRQLNVADSVCEQIARGSNFISGVMIESHLVEGRQDLVKGKELTYGQSITDGCICWEDSEKVLFQLAEAVEQRRKLNG
ncbi:3-deoxy-7-phosphoheptulonate synthase AroG [Ursidibacter maritimus]|uniref:Phospho-2-dehydro-3-deoxyheptonate aldolase n=1 Tax=Ursidibacter maritimus TaxID=1331689 RepID=A0A949T4N5_9PAST|nr:3-deoxy-7-phosphoheptulonate synthase AroG [Ursidibacter maritimus]KAE9538989.1 3-deoxy-7-phosphoheptulonate synthase [Ursidibacter maritimus]MBV6523727.1 3-deoxy-7-phosphoheptulonate synthase AroG [Ursidibacter maritimus]MBV6526006.1 3-deoxy-7-phosphoheptulonate synthase AroG [Ursidibacter maritimus]MBV6527921.1 3-deoxy-7-phosphoheptulonate synthase AroG [Ursidibacter maritimus]MBV6528860.1 3-deoxy-7-phosphoheptulonate synthase AroG [Ursidibacter maritimus]